MKYMTFNSSCPYAGMANMLEKYGIDVEDYEIALEMKLPLFVDKNEDGYVTGPMIQEKKWFDIFLNRYGFELLEESVDKAKVFDYLCSKETAMLGVKFDNGRNQYHALVYVGFEDGKLVFINNKHEGSDEPERVTFDKNELEECIRDVTVVATLEPCEKRDVDITPFLKDSIEKLNSLQKDFVDFCNKPHTNKELLENERGLFRPILLDGPTMMKLYGQEELYEDMCVLQRAFIDVAFKNKSDNTLLNSCFDMKLMDTVFDRWKQLINEALD